MIVSSRQAASIHPQMLWDPYKLGGKLRNLVTMRMMVMIMRMVLITMTMTMKLTMVSMMMYASIYPQLLVVGTFQTWCQKLTVKTR